MRGTYSIGKRFLAMLLCIAMVAAYLPGMALSASAADTADKVADPSTMDGWEKFFGPNVLNTEFAGGVWTDKSVFADASEFSGVTMDDDSFLVAMSAIAANKKVEGQSTLPTDTMLVLDLSNSMDTLGAIPDMVDAANATIHKLLNMNSYNRVGVVLYSGNSQQGNASSNTATVILPLGRYTPNSSDEYLDYTGSANNTTVIRAAGMTYEDGTAVSGTASKQTNGATYIQNGLYKAWQEFEDVTDPTITSGIMAGTKRTPVYILMSDGEPTVATTSYYNVGQSGVGNGTTPSNQTTRNQLTFLTQLTASWVKGKAEAKYGTDAKFYTLGLGIDENESATAVLSPASTNTTVSTWWTRFLAGTAGQNVDVYGNSGTWNIYRDGAVSERNYVDMFKSADNADELPELFDDIVAAIEEAAYSATLVTTDDYDMDGYITFEDEIGELMEVRDIKGILLGDTLFSGADLAKSMGEGLLGSSSNPQSLGIELVATVQERIGIEDVSVAQQLIRSAYQAGQISYDETTGQYSNYIGWYAGENGEFISFWQESYGYTLETAPEGAKYINKSYGYLGVAGDSNMMHVVVQVSTEINTSHQTVLFKIPASLIPTVTYRVGLDGVELEDASTLTREGAEPMRLLFEVGLRSDINTINLEEKVAEYLAEDPSHHVHQNADGSYTFYTNRWGHGDSDQTPIYNEDLMDYVAESHFHPSYENERYYYTEATAIYVKNGDGYVLYTGDAQPKGTGYYHRRTVVTANTNGGSASIKYIYAPISEVTLEDTDHVIKSGNNWYVGEGVAYTETARFDVLKTDNATETLEYSNYPLVVHDAEGYNIYAVLGNNGKLTIAPAQGIKLSKTVSQTSPDANAPTLFEFTVTFDTAIASNEIKLTDADENAFTGDYSVASSGGKTVVTVTLAHGQEVYITGIPTGTGYEVHETQTVYYNSDKDNDTATGSVAANHIDSVVFTNTPRQPGQLTITKTVNHPFADRPAALNNILFTFEVDLGEQAAGMTFDLADGTKTPAADENGVITMTIKAEQTITIQGILEDTPYEVREVNVPQGFQWDQAASSGLSGRVSGAAHLVNNYVPTPSVTNPEVDIVINKTLTGDFTQDETFTFLVEKLNPDTNQYEVLGAKTVNVAWPTTSTGTVSLGDIISGFTTLGSHTFRITEAAGSTVGMTYSNQISTFQVNVVDPEMDGILEIEVVGLTNTTVAEDNDGYTVTASFTNVYYVGSTYVDVNIHKNLINETGVELSVTDFQFGLYTDPACTQLAQIIDGEHLTVYAGPLGNAVIRIPVTNISQDGAVYYLKEIVPANPLPGMTYSDAVYQVTLQVEAVQQSRNATLAAEATISLYSGSGQVSGSEVTFSNEFVLQETSAEIKGIKHYIRGYDQETLPMNAGDFTFELWSANSDYTANTLLGTVTNAADGTFVFSGLEELTYSKVGRYVYILREVAGSNNAITYAPLDYYVLVIVTQGEGDTLTAAVHYREEGATTGSTQASFTNTYNVSGETQTVIRGTKTLNVIQGQKIMAGGDFIFGLYKGTDTTAQPIDTAANWANGGFAFNTITYTAADVGKTFTYTVKEIAPAGAVANPDGTYTLNGVTYSNVSFKVEVEIVDNGDGTISAVQTVVGSAGIAFTNDYKADDTTYTISGQKNLSGRDLEAGEFIFYLYETGEDFAIQGDPIDEVTNSADGSFSFDTITYNAVGTHYYVVREHVPAVDADDRLGGVSYDAGVYQITVRVSDSGSGKLAAVATVYQPGSTSTEVVFRNGYTTEPATLVLGAQKTYDKPIAGDDFTFILEGDIDGTEVSQEKTNDAAGKVTFDELTFDKVGTYTFTVIEKDNVTSFPWIDFDKTEYTVTVTVTDNGVGQLVADVKYSTKDGDIDSISFKNTYKIIEDAEVTLGGNKYYMGDELTAGQFEFGLYEDAACTQLIGQTVSNTVETIDLGRFVFPTIEYKDVHIDDLPATYTYYIKEIMPEGVQEVKDTEGNTDYVLDGVFYDPTVYKVEVVLTDNGTGGVNVQTLVNGIEDDEIAFTNAYNIVSGTEVVLRGNKIVHNKAIEEGKYTFGLYEEGQTRPKFTTTNLADGTFVFPALEYDENTPVGTVYNYTVREILPEGTVNNKYEGITYDTTVYNVKVEIAHDGDGNLQEIVTITGGDTNNAIIFNNYYEITGSGTTTIEGKKYYNNANGTQMSVDAGEFSFALYENNTVVGTAATIAGGVFSFELTYGPGDVGKTFTYQVRETAGEAGYITYDERVYTVVVEVKDNGVGGIEVTKTINGAADTAVEFTNTYTNTGKDSLTLVGEKKYYDIRLKDYVNVPVNMFTFLLKDASGAVLQQTRNLADGTFAFQPIEYTAEDIGEIFRYTIVEHNGGLTYIGYDDRVYEVVVTVTDNGEGGITVTKTINGEADTKVEFENSYTVSGTADLTLGGRKLYTNSLTGLLKELPAGTFQFNITGPKVNETVSNKLGGAFQFSAITYGVEDIGQTYVYTVSEVKGDLDYIIYDADVFTVTVTVSDNGQGGIAVDKVITVNESQTAAIAFDNYYDVVKPGTVEIPGSKTYTDSRTGDKKEMEAFTFRLTGHGQNLIAVNDENGNFKFEIPYTKADIGKEFIYTVSEVKGDKDYITYDTDTFQVKVKVEDDGFGGLKITKTIENNADIAFQNYYNIIGDGSVELGGTKTYIDNRTQQAKPITAGMFSFRISGNGVDETVKVAADGSFRFSALTYDADDVGNTYTYTIEEVAGDKDYITYDGTKYTLQVKVEDNGEGGLKITKLLGGTATDNISVAFRNLYNIIHDAEVAVSGTKTYTDGRTEAAKQIPADLFSFKITGSDGYTETVKNAAGGSFSFENLKYDASNIGHTYTYTIEEVKGDKGYITYDTTKHTLMVSITDDGAGGLKITKILNGTVTDTITVSFENTYNIISGGSVEIDGTKTYEGRDLEGEDFTFILSQGDKEIERVKNARDGSFSFAALEYTASDIGNTYTYTVEELRPEGLEKNEDGVYVLDGIIYDANVYTVEVTVEDNGEGGLKITKKVNNTEAEQISVLFDNKYQITGTGVLELTGTKTLTGGKPLADGAFTFGLYLDGKEIDTDTNANGEFTLTDTYEVGDLGEYTYTVSEIDGSIDEITYDETVYTVNVKVYDNEKGGIAVDYEIVDADRILFENVYTPADITVGLGIQKTVQSQAAQSIGPEGFKFCLVDETGKELSTAETDKQGNAEFQLGFDAEDIGKTFKFTVSEIDTKRTGVVYSTVKYVVAVTIGQDAEGRLISVISIDGEQTQDAALKFVNIYEPSSTPVTGDSFDAGLFINLMVLSSFGLAAVMICKKREDTKENAE